MHLSQIYNNVQPFILDVAYHLYLFSFFLAHNCQTLIFLRDLFDFPVLLIKT